MLISSCKKIKLRIKLLKKREKDYNVNYYYILISKKLINNDILITLVGLKKFEIL